MDVGIHVPIFDIDGGTTAIAGALARVGTAVEASGANWLSFMDHFFQIEPTGLPAETLRLVASTATPATSSQFTTRCRAQAQRPAAPLRRRRPRLRHDPKNRVCEQSQAHPGNARRLRRPNGRLREARRADRDHHAHQRLTRGLDRRHGTGLSAARRPRLGPRPAALRGVRRRY